MRDAIVAKLATLCHAGITTERDVVYFLVELGKLLERENNRAGYPTITFYRDWSVHSLIDRSAVAKDMLLRIDAAVKELDAAQGDAEFSAFVSKLISFDELRREIELVCATYGLYRALDDASWGTFRSNLTSVLADCPLRIANPKGVHEFTLSSEPHYTGKTGTQYAWVMNLPKARRIIGPVFG
jgi:hypothetical protein